MNNVISLAFELVNNQSTNETHTSYDYSLKEIEMEVTTGSSQDPSHVWMAIHAPFAMTFTISDAKTRGKTKD